MNYVFVGGCGRSGTTLLGSMLGTHSQCLATPESRFLLDVHRASVTPDGGTDAGRLIDALGSHPLFRIWQTNPIDIQMATPGASNQFAVAFENVVSAYGDSIDSSTFDTWIDHTPENVNRPSMLQELFPVEVCTDAGRRGRKPTRIDQQRGEVAMCPRHGHCEPSVYVRGFAVVNGRWS